MTRRKVEATLPERQAAWLNTYHETHCWGFYGSWGGRYFAARVNEGKLQVSDDFGGNWIDVPEGGYFRGPHSMAALPLPA